MTRVGSCPHVWTVRHAGAASLRTNTRDRRYALTCDDSAGGGRVLLTQLTGSVHVRAEVQVLVRGAMLIRHVGDAIGLVGGLGEGVAAAGRVRAMRVMKMMMMLVQFGAKRLDDFIFLLQLLTESETHR